MKFFEKLIFIVITVLISVLISNVLISNVLIHYIQNQTVDYETIDNANVHSINLKDRKVCFVEHGVMTCFLNGIETKDENYVTVGRTRKMGHEHCEERCIEECLHLDRIFCGESNDHGTCVTIEDGVPPGMFVEALTEFIDQENNSKRYKCQLKCEKEHCIK